MTTRSGLPVGALCLAIAVGAFLNTHATAEVAENAPPSVTITRPASGGAVPPQEPVRIEALASDADGSVVSVIFVLDGGAPILARSLPGLWYFDIPAIPPGNHSLIAIAVDNQGASTDSEPVHFRTGFRPTLTLQGRRVDGPEPHVELLATAVDPDGQVDHVLFRRQNEVIARVDTPPYRVEIPVPDEGSRSWEAWAIDDSGVESLVVTATVGADPLAGDNFRNAPFLRGSDLTLTANSRTATREEGEPDHQGVPGGHSLWWNWWSPPGTAGYLLIDTEGSSFDTVVAVYTGAAFGTLIPRTTATSARTVKARVDNATHFNLRIAVDGRDGAAGDVRLRLRFIPDVPPGPIPNDAFASRIQFGGASGEVTGFSLGARAEPDEPRHAGFPPRRSIWWTWFAREDGMLELTTQGSSFDTILAVYTGGPNLADLVAIASNDDMSGDQHASRVEIPVQAGTPYHIAVDSADPTPGFVRLTHRFRPHLTARLLREDDGRLILAAETGNPGSWRVEGSENLQVWDHLEAVETSDGVIRWNVPTPKPSPDPRFFRLIQP